MLTIRNCTYQTPCTFEYFRHPSAPLAPPRHRRYPSCLHIVISRLHTKRCTVMLLNERLGEFAQEIKASVDLPLPAAEVSLHITARDGGGSSSHAAVQRDLLLPSKNAALQNALFGVLLERSATSTLGHLTADIIRIDDKPTSALVPSPHPALPPVLVVYVEIFCPVIIHAIISLCTDSPTPLQHKNRAMLVPPSSFPSVLTEVDSKAIVGPGPGRQWQQSGRTRQKRHHQR